MFFLLHMAQLYVLRSALRLSCPGAMLLFERWDRWKFRNELRSCVSVSPTDTFDMLTLSMLSIDNLKFCSWPDNGVFDTNWGQNSTHRTNIDLTFRLIGPSIKHQTNYLPLVNPIISGLLRAFKLRNPKTAENCTWMTKCSFHCPWT